MQAGGGVGHAVQPGGITIRSALQQVFRDSGWKGFWRGNGTNVLKIMPESGVKFMAYDFAKQMLCEDVNSPQFRERFCAGSFAGLTSQFVIYPLDIVKTRLAISSQGQYSSILDCLRQTVVHEGPLAVYKGLGPALCGIVPAVGIDMAIYNTLKDEYRAHLLRESKKRGTVTELSEPSVMVSLSCGAISSVCGAVASYPLVVTRTRLMAQGMPGRPTRYRGALHCFVSIFQEEGVRGLYRGQIPSLMKTIPSVSIGYAVYDATKQMLGMRGL